MTETKYESHSETFNQHITDTDVKNRLALLNHHDEAKRFGVSRPTITNVVNGARPWSPLVPKLARRIKVPAATLRSYLVDLSASRLAQKNL